MNNIHAMILVATMAAVTFLIRALPFLVFSSKDKTPKVILYLGDVLPCAIIGMLVVYCLKDVSFTGPTHAVPEIVSVAAVAALQAWKRNSLLSILAGTLIYMGLVQFVFT